MNSRQQDYIIGLDIGTNSVGWAVTDSHYNLLHFKKKDLWGVRLFKGADTAKARRVFRSTRRIYRRRHNRLKWLNEIFSKELYRVDKSFLTRMNSSWISKKDKTRKRDKYNLFIDENFTDSEYYKKYPTIFHLRKRLIEDTSKADIRLVYLAIHNIIKYRGNFNYENKKFDISHIAGGLSPALEDLSNLLHLFGIEFTNKDNSKKISSILIKDEGTKKRIDDIFETMRLDKDSKKNTRQVLNLILGNKSDLNIIFSINLDKDNSKLSLSDGDIESSLEKFQSLLTEDQFKVITTANEIYSTIILNKILDDKSKYISFAKVKQYENHKDDLAILKTMWNNPKNKEISQTAKQAYKDYLDKNKYGRQELYLDLKKFFKVAKPENLATDTLKKIENEKYLLKQRSTDNAVIPFQLNKYELEEIIDNQSKYYPFLLEDKEKLISLLSFRIPYYVGPLQSNNNKFAWMERKAKGNIRPWNFDDLVDREKSSNKFIKRMTGTDTFLIGEPVLPKNSLIYQKYEVLNELNNIRVITNEYENPLGEKLTVEIKQQAYDELFKKYKTVKTKTMIDWLKFKGFYVAPRISGLSQPDQFNSNLDTYIDMKGIFESNFVDNPDNLNQLEELIEWLTVFEDKKILSEKLNNSSYNYTDKQINKLSNIRYKGWGKLSLESLTQIKTNSNLKDDKSILDLMWETKNNFIQIFHNNKYEFEKKFEDYNLGKNSELDTSELIDDIHTSPALKRGIKQSLLLVNEIVKFMGHNPSHIFVEVTRESSKKEITDSRYKRLTKIYSTLKNKSNEIIDDQKEYIIPSKKLEKELGKYGTQLSNEKYMLYFLQNGHSVYSPKSFNINDLSNYEVDHIIPRSYIPDNSLENKALVFSGENQNKSDSLLLTQEIINKNINRWQYMLDHGMMGPKKFKNLTRTKITENDQKGFINRQLVQTSQIIKQVINILNLQFKDSETICLQSKANLSTSLRAAFSGEKKDFHFKHPEFVKNRDVNDLHHAQDAYLACLLGIYCLHEFPTDEMLLVQKKYKEFFSKTKESFRKNGKLPDSDANGFIISPMIKGTKHFTRDDFKKVSNIFKYKQCNITNKPTFGKGQFYKQTIYSPKEKKNLVPLNERLDSTIYGGYTNQETAYTDIIRINKKSYKLIKIPIEIAKKISKNKINPHEWIRSNVEPKRPFEIIKERVPKGQLTYSKTNGYLSIVSGSEIENAQQLFLSYESIALLTILKKSDAIKHNQILAFYDKDILNNIFLEILGKMKKFYPFYDNERKFLEKSYDSFKDAIIEDKINTLFELLKMLHAISGDATFEFNNISKDRFGRKRSMNIKNTDLIYKSPTGLYESKFHID